MFIFDVAGTAVLAAISVAVGAVAGIFVIKYCGDVLMPLKGMDAERWAWATVYGVPTGALAGLYATFQLRKKIKDWL